MQKLKIDDFLKYRFISDLSFSPDGKHLAFAVHEMDQDENKYNSKIWLYKTEYPQLLQLTFFGDERIFTWLDKETLLFASLRNEKDRKRKDNGEQLTVFYKININGGEAQRAFEIPLMVRKIEYIGQKKFVFTAIYDPEIPDLSKMNEAEKQEWLRKAKEEKDYEVVDEIPFWSNGSGFTNKKRTRLYIYDENSSTILPITDEYTNVEHFSINPDRKKLLFISNRFEKKMEIKSDLHLYTFEDEKLTKLTHEDRFDYEIAYFLKNKIIFAGKDMRKYGINENPRFYILDPQTRTTRVITPNFDRSLRNSVNSDCRYGANRIAKIDGDHLYFISTDWHSSHLYKIDENGNINQLTLEDGSVDGFDVYEDKIIFVGMRNMKLQELYTVKENKEQQITFFNEWLVKERNLSKPERFTFQSRDGTTLEGWIIKPADFDDAKKYPAIVDIHGGPKTVYGEVFFHEMQFWANEGYVVLFTNPRGSDGRGNEFADIRGKYGTVDYEDLMDFVDAALKRYQFIDENRMGVTGGSYGGFMTNWIIGHTDRFRAAVSQRSIANWISKFGTTDIGYFFVEDQHLATPWNNQEKLWWHSPMKYADRAKTPTLFIHSDEDYRCWLVEAIQMFTSLRYNNVDTKLVIFKGENHELSRGGKPKHRVRRLKEITEWFNKYLK